ncbi:MAG: radical SAM protein [Chloroflexi bacterium]|nr:radical SAM protein [Chloroflexota bacterium]
MVQLPAVTIAADSIDKLRLLAPTTCVEVAEDANSGRDAPIRAPQGAADLSDCIHHAVVPGGGRIALLKTLQTSVCENNCSYCAFRRGRDFRRVSFSPDELARLFIQLYQKGIAKGIFLSSGVAGGGAKVQDRLIATAEVLRRRYSFTGYIHLKIMPGAERDQISAAMRLADRVSVNLEAPNHRHLDRLAPEKSFEEQLLLRLRWIEEIRREEPGHWPSSTTQFVVGGSDETDVELLSTTEYLYRQLGLARAYFSSFSPVPDTPLEHQPASPLLREHRLYQSSFLLRDYGFVVEDLPFNQTGNLPLDTDPKLAWAQRHLTDDPVELNTADRHTLLQVPGIGPVGANRILKERRRGHLRDLADLRRLGITATRLAPFVLLDGHRPAFQMSIWPLDRPSPVHGMPLAR